MKRLLIIFVLVLCWTDVTYAQKGEVLSADAFDKKLAATPQGQLLDVRTKEEFSDKHLKDALNADYNQPDQFKERVRYLDKDKPVFVYCLSGGRSAKATEYLREQGFKEVYDMQGGIRSWVASNKPVAETAGRVKKPGMTSAEFQKQLTQYPQKLVLVDFGAKWCPPCKKMAPELADLAKTQAQTLVILPLDVDENQNLSQTYQVNVLPTLFLYKNGKKVWQHEGYASREVIMAQVKKHQ